MAEEQADTPIVEDALLGGRLRLRQPARGHRAGTDAVLLAAALDPREGCLMDAGAGVGTAGLAIARRQPALVTVLVEQDPLSADLAIDNARANGLDGRVSVVRADLLQASARRAAGLADGMADALVSNPPWQAPAAGRVSPDARRAAAHAFAEGSVGLEGWMRAVAALLRPGGRFALIHRADHLPALLAACEGRFGALSLLPIQPRAAQEAHRVILRGIKGSRAPFRLLTALVLHEEAGGFTPLAEALHQGEALLPEA